MSEKNNNKTYIIIILIVLAIYFINTSDLGFQAAYTGSTQENMLEGNITNSLLLNRDSPNHINKTSYGFINITNKTKSGKAYLSYKLIGSDSLNGDPDEWSGDYWREKDWNTDCTSCRTYYIQESRQKLVLSFLNQETKKYEVVFEKEANKESFYAKYNPFSAYLLDDLLFNVPWDYTLSGRLVRDIENDGTCTEYFLINSDHCIYSNWKCYRNGDTWDSNNDYRGHNNKCLYPEIDVSSKYIRDYHYVDVKLFLEGEHIRAPTNLISGLMYKDGEASLDSLKLIPNPLTLDEEQEILNEENKILCLEIPFSDWVDTINGLQLAQPGCSCISGYEMIEGMCEEIIIETPLEDITPQEINDSQDVTNQDTTFPPDTSKTSNFTTTQIVTIVLSVGTITYLFINNQRLQGRALRSRRKTKKFFKRKR